MCQAVWLLHEIGPGPQLSSASISPEQSQTKAYLTDNQCISQEFLVFRCLHHATVDWVVSDDGMLPWFQLGDYIAGIARRGEAIQTLIGKDCIVQTARCDQLLRRIKLGSQPHLYGTYIL